MCECTPKTPGRYCCQPGCTDPVLRAQAKNAQRYLKWRADHTRSADAEMTELGLALSDAWTAEQVDAALDAALEVELEAEQWREVVAHAAAELEPLDDETAQAQVKALRELLGAT